MVVEDKPSGRPAESAASVLPTLTPPTSLSSSLLTSSTHTSIARMNTPISLFSKAMCSAWAMPTALPSRKS